MTRPRIGISGCLIGQRVRYDGGHKRADSVLKALGKHVTWVSVCPELEVGMGVPREPVKLVRGRMVGVESGRDWTRRMEQFARRRIRALDLDGYVLKARSPSCDPRFGLFARALPDLPVMHEGMDPARFLTRVRAYRARRTS
jgi:uncharacterized protein YbbK (DUF523 family)